LRGLDHFGDYALKEGPSTPFTKRAERNDDVDSCGLRYLDPRYNLIFLH